MQPACFEIYHWEIGGNYHNEGKCCKPQVCAVLIVVGFTAKCDRYKWQTHVTLKKVAFFWERLLFLNSSDFFMKFYFSSV